MKSINLWRRKLSSWFYGIVDNVNKEYQLDKYILPDLEKIKRAHELLLREYVHTLSAISRLSFFVGAHEVRFSRSGPSRGVFFILLSKFLPFRLFILRPLVNLFAELHIQAKLKELRLIYSQTSYLIPFNYHQRDEYLDWLKQAQDDCNGLVGTLSFPKITFDTLKYSALFSGAIILAAMGVGSIQEFLNLLFSNSLTVQDFRVIGITLVVAITFSPYIFALYEMTFDTKRSIFLNIKPVDNPVNNIYGLENNVFDLLGRGKSKEFPVDYWIDLFFHVASVAFLWWIHLIFVSLPSSTNTIVCDWTWCIIVPLLIKLIVDVIIPWHRRIVSREI